MAYWVLPPSVKELLYAPLSQLFGSLWCPENTPITISCDFTTTYNCTNHTINSYDVTCNFTTFPTLQHFPIPSSGEVGHLLASLSTCSTKPAILALLVDYSSNYIPSSLARGLPTCLSDMLKHVYLNKPFDELLQIAAETEIVSNEN